MEKENIIPEKQNKTKQNKQTNKLQNEDKKRIGPLPMALVLCVFLPALLIKDCALLFFYPHNRKLKKKKKNVSHIAVFGCATGNIFLVWPKSTL